MKQEAEQFLSELQGKGILLGLERTLSFLDFLGNPQDNFKSIHVAGTNGKGSACAMLERILREAGFKTGLYTSPHLVSLNERIQANGLKIPEEELEERVLKLKKTMVEKNFQLTYFEFLTVLAFQFFSDKKIDFAVVETGMGGRLDATNVLQPLVSIITNIALEHTQHLGNTLEKIAFEKAGIIKENGVLVTTEKNKKILRLFKKTCGKKNSKFIAIKKPYKKSKVGLTGEHQFWNAALAFETAKILGKKFKIPRSAVEKGIAKAEWPARFQVLRGKPLVVLDSAHNPAGAKALKKTMLAEFPSKKVLLVFGAASDKDISGIAREIVPLAREVFLASAKERGADTKILAREAKKYCKSVRAFESVGSAVEEALKTKNEIVLITGSIFLIGEAIPVIKAFFKEKVFCEAFSQGFLRPCKNNGFARPREALRAFKNIDRFLYKN